MARRSWVAARAKVDREARCRVCGTPWGVEAAHIIPRSRVSPGPGEDERNIVPLCRGCHAEFDGHRLALGAFLTRDELGYAAGLVGEFEADRRINKRRDVA